MSIFAGKTLMIIGGTGSFFLSFPHNKRKGQNQTRTQSRKRSADARV